MLTYEHIAAGEGGYVEVAYAPGLARVGRKIRALSKHTWVSSLEAWSCPLFCHTMGRKIRPRAPNYQTDAPDNTQRSPFTPGRPEARAGGDGGPSQEGGGRCNMGLFVFF